MGQSCGVKYSSKSTIAHQHSTNTSHPHTPHLPRGQMRHQKKIILGREGEVTTSFTTWNMLERVCTTKDNVIWYKDLFQSSWLLSLDNSNLSRGKIRGKLETCIPEMMFWSYCTCATPVTVIATPSAVSTSSHLGCNVIISREILPKNVKCLHVSRLHTLSSFLCISCPGLPAALITGNARQAQNAAKEPRL